MMKTSVTPKKHAPTPTPTIDELKATLETATAAFNVALAAYHKMPCTLTENNRRAAFIAEDRAYEALRATGALNY